MGWKDWGVGFLVALIFAMMITFGTISLTVWVDKILRF